MSGFAVVIVEAGGVPVVNVPSGAPAAKEVLPADGGIAVTLVADGGTPLVIETLP